MTKESLYRQLDEAKDSGYADAFIAAVNADHVDVISVPRDVACRIRDHIELLRRKSDTKRKEAV